MEQDRLPKNSNVLNINQYLNSAIVQQLNSELQNAVRAHGVSINITEQTKQLFKPVVDHLYRIHSIDEANYSHVQQVVTEKKDALQQTSAFGSIFDASRRSLRHILRASLHEERAWMKNCAQKVAGDETVLHHLVMVMRATRRLENDRTDGSSRLGNQIRRIGTTIR